MRKSILIILSALLGVFSARAYDFEVDGIYYNHISGTDDHVAVTYKANYYGYRSDYTGSVVIPSTVTYNGTSYSVTSIGNYAFSGCTSLTSVTIPESVTSIGQYAFSSCSGLTAVTIPNSVTSIGKSAFEDCTGLTSVTIPNSLTTIGNSAFRDCSGLTSVTIPESVTKIEAQAFYGCSGLTSVTIPNSVTKIEAQAFYDCSGLTSVTIPESVTSIGAYAFSGCTSITSPLYNSKIFAYMPENYSGEYAIPSGIQSIADAAFYRCSGLTSVTIPNSLTTIGNSAFYECSGLTSVTIPESVTSIGAWAFQSCASLTSVTIPESVTEISHSAFSGCTSITRPLYNSKIFAYLPQSYSGEYAIPSGIQSIAPTAFEDCSSLTSVTIPERVTRIGTSAFRNCSGLTSVTIPESVTFIESQAFYGCSGLTSVTSLAQTPPFCFSVFSDYSATLFVPYGSKEAYQTAQEWNNFSKIEELATVTLSVNNSAWGTASQSGNGIYKKDSVATISATPNTGYHFVKWSDDNTDNPRTLTVTGDTTLTAIFAPFIEVTLSATEGGTVTQSGDGTYKQDSIVTITATPNESYRFVNWTKADGTEFSTESVLTFAVTENLELTANFLKTFTVSVSANNAAWGSVTITGNSPYDTAASVTITATPNKGYRFVNWTKDNEVFGTDSMYTFTVNENLTLTANFEEIPPVVVVKTYTVSVSANNAAWGSVSQSGTGTYDSATSVIITATPNEGYRFVNWTKGNEVFGTDSLHTFTVNEDLTLVANFEKMPDAPIDPDTPTANENAKADNLRIYVQDRTIHLSEDRGTVQVYNMAGQRIYNGHATAIPVRQSGVYIVAVGQQRFKVSIR